MTLHEPLETTDGGPEALRTARDALRLIRKEAEATITPQGPLYRATHRIDTPRLPPLFLLRLGDADRTMHERGEAGGTLSVLVKDRQGRDQWQLERIW